MFCYTEGLQEMQLNKDFETSVQLAINNASQCVGALGLCKQASSSSFLYPFHRLTTALPFLKDAA
jgi:hypothetical protein